MDEEALRREIDLNAHAQEMCKTQAWEDYIAFVEGDMEQQIKALLVTRDPGDLRYLAGKLEVLRAIREYPETRAHRANQAQEALTREDDSLS